MPVPDRERSRFYSTRPRRVPPEFCTDELLESCSVTAALLMYRTVSQADDQGRLPGSAKSIRATCFAMRSEITERKVASAIGELVGAGFLIRYEIDGRAFLQVDHWTDLQGRWGCRAYPSRYPAPPGWTGDWVNVKPEESAASDANRAPSAGEVRAPSTQDARTLRAPVPVPSPFSSSITPSGLSTPARGMRGWESTGELLRAAAGERGTREGTQEAIPRRSVR
jgi:hypothetical protein